MDVNKYSKKERDATEMALGENKGKCEQTEEQAGHDCTRTTKHAPADSKREVALVLSSGGARGCAHIGVIEALVERGYRIRSVTGSSMGALVGGAYAAGRMEELKEWLSGLGRRKMFALMDVRPGMNYWVDGGRLMEVMERVVGNPLIENLPIEFRAVASDLRRAREVMFARGPLLTAIRSSISIPSMFRPVHGHSRLLVDGALTDPLPLRRAPRHENELLVAANVSGIADPALDARRERAERMRPGLAARVGRAALMKMGGTEWNYFGLLMQSFDLMVQQNAHLTTLLTPPDLLLEIPMNFVGAFDFHRANWIAARGKALMLRRIDEYEARTLS